MIQILIQIATHLASNKQKLPVAYVAGKVTDLPYGEVFAKFKLKQAELEAEGYFVLNPCDFIAETEDWDKAMRIAVMLLASSGTIALIPDWRDSKGARLEFELSQPLGLSVIH
jgi:hypothetical protein